MDAPTSTGRIYILTSPSGKSYIGQTKSSFEKRLRAHKTMSRSSKGINPVYAAARKYDWQNMICRVLEDDVPFEELDSAEKFWIEVAGTLCPSGYNLRTGGQGGFVFTDSVRRKISKSNTGRVRPQWERDKISNTMKGVCKSPATRAKMRIAQVGTRPSKKALAASSKARSRPVVGVNLLTGRIKRFNSGVSASAFFKRPKTFAHGVILKSTLTRDFWVLSYEPR